MTISYGELQVRSATYHSDLCEGRLSPPTFRRTGLRTISKSRHAEADSLFRRPHVFSDIDGLCTSHTTKVNRPGRSSIQCPGNKPAPSRLVQARLIIGSSSLRDCARRTQPRTTKFLVIDYILSYLCRMSLTKLRRHVSCIMNNPVAHRDCELSNWPSTHRNSGTTRVPLGISSAYDG